MHRENITTAGSKIQDAAKALIMLHGRGGNAKDILSLSDHLHVTGKDMGATVTEKVYENMGHTINQDEIDLANTLIFNINSAHHEK